MDDQPKPPTTGERFDADYYERVYTVSGIKRFDIHWWANRYYARLAERLLAKSGGTKLLDVGCGQGFMLNQLGPHVRSWGVEISEYALSRCSIFAPQAKVFLGNIEDGIPPEIPAGEFDVVVARYVLEHLRDPGAAIARCASLLRPGGYFLFSVPNTASPGKRIKGDRWFAALDETHISLLPPEEWRRLIAANGLHLEREFSDGLWDVPYINAVPRLLQYGVFSLPTIFAVFFVSTALPLSWGENLIAYARK